MSRIAVFALLLTMTMPAAAADSAPLGPFLDDQTLAVGHVDVTRVDVDALAAWLVRVGEADAGDLDAPKQAVRKWLGAFTKAGGKDLYAVVSLADLPDQPLIIVPLAQEADAESIKTLLRQVGLDQVETRGRLVLAGGRSTLRRVDTFKPRSVPEVAQAFAAAGDTAGQVVFVPTATLRRSFEEMMPTLPKDLGGGPVTRLTRGLHWVAVGLDLPPRASLRLTIQTQDAASAQALREAITKFYQVLGQTEQVRTRVPEFDRTAALLVPQVEGDHLVLSLDGRKLEAVFLPLVLPLLREGSVKVRENPPRGR